MSCHLHPFVYLAVAAVALGTASAESQQCKGTLACRHGGTCADGNATYGFLEQFSDLPFLSAKNIDNEHCECPANRTGIDCGTKVQTCDEKSGYSCFNNGECKTKIMAQDPVVEYFHCDCSTAHKDGNENFAGEFCQFESTQVCDAKDDGLEVDSWFCVNGGTCHGNESDINKKCSCPNGWTGPHCEFKQYAMIAEKKCDLPCENRGQCKHGSKQNLGGYMNFLADATGKEINDMHCVCPNGYFGTMCEAEVGKCGKKYCFNGSKCMKETNLNTRETVEHCDCTTTNEEYAGLYCEHKAMVRCDKLDANSPFSPFCTNGGICPERHEKVHMGCECEDGFSGAHCEFKGEEPPCTLKCSNGGQCRHGINPNVAGLLGSKFDLSLPTHKGFMHCACPEGYLGVDCGVQYEVCGEKAEARHACANGGKCIITGMKKNGKPEYACDCGTRTPFAGTHCEHGATTFCAKSEDAEGSHHAFCTNGGKCTQIVNANEAHPGCQCPDEWEGEHCQYKKGHSPVATLAHVAESDEISGSKTGMAFGVAVSVLIFVGLIAGFAGVKLRRRQANSIAKAAGADDATGNRPRSEVSGNGGKGEFNSEDRLHDVDIL